MSCLTVLDMQSCISNRDVHLVDRWEVNKMALSLWRLTVEYAFYFRILFSCTVTPTKTHCCLSYANFILHTCTKILAFFVGVHTGCIHQEFLLLFILQKLLFHLYILKYNPMEIVSPALPVLRRQPGLAVRSSSSPRVMIESCPLSHFHTCSFTLKTQCCFSAGELEPTAKANLAAVLKSKQQHKTKSLTSWEIQV